MLNTHYLSHLSQQPVRWQEPGLQSFPGEETSHRMMEMFLYWAERSENRLLLVLLTQLWQLVKSPNENMRHVIRSLSLHLGCVCGSAGRCERQREALIAPPWVFELELQTEPASFTSSTSRSLLTSTGSVDESADPQSLNLQGSWKIITENDK